MLFSCWAWMYSYSWAIIINVKGHHLCAIFSAHFMSASFKFYKKYILHRFFGMSERCAVITGCDLAIAKKCSCKYLDFYCFKISSSSPNYRNKHQSLLSKQTFGFQTFLPFTLFYLECWWKFIWSKNFIFENFTFFCRREES